MRSLFALVLALAPVRAAAAEPVLEAKDVDAVVESALKEFQAPGAAVVVVKDDKVIHLKGYGVRRLGGDAAVTPDTVFPIASCSKPFTAALLAQLVDAGKLKWDDRVSDHLDLFRLSDPLADREVTFRDLLSHRTGMPRHDMLWVAYTADTSDLIRRWGRAKSSTSFRSTWEYANVPFTTAGVVAGKLNGSDWAAAAKARLFDPLGMASTSGTAKAGQAAADHATPHYRGFDRSITPIIWDDIDHAGGAGCINSTARDMGNWLRAQLAGGKLGDKDVIPARQLKEMHSPQMVVKTDGAFAPFFPAKSTAYASYGLGWFVHDYRGHKCVSHGGTLTGFRAQCMMIPEKKLGVFVACNLRPSALPEVVTKSVLDRALGLPLEDWVKFHKEGFALAELNVINARVKRDKEQKKDTKPSLAPEKYAGRYEDRAYGTAVVAEADGKLMLRWGRLALRLDHYHFDTFTAVPVEPRDEVVSFDRTTLDVRFRLGTNGDVEGLTFLEQDFRREAGKK
ncbi:serine hydrolase [Urbifossiella limnaea]|uniref:D-alanyl-D-alanine carboxypeptidase n=1 Tax=Urbifossiella limnaea TaxID=2528023 RepID=A0A517XVY6_9BACT|nr:serine hydrolase [Urbifossiella limnaea]QDU21678.1 D-alanyl-D-alanine carboxypeptidase precursor [Urbifossiella limnaea]